MPIEKIKFSASTGGIPVAITFATNTTIHTTGTSSSIIDCIYLYAWNNAVSGTVNIEVRFGDGGGSGGTRTVIKQTITFGNLPVTILEGIPLRGNGTTGSTLTVLSNNANTFVTGFVNRIS